MGAVGPLNLGDIAILNLGDELSSRLAIIQILTVIRFESVL